MTEPTVLLTGSTGFVGGATAAELLQKHPSCGLLLLARGDANGPPDVRVRRSLARFVDPGRLEPLLSGCVTIHGDLTDPSTLVDPRLASVTHVLHLAANTSFRSVRSVRRTNVLGTLALAHRLRRAAKLERFLYVGTAYICGAEPPRVVLEDDYPRPDTRHLAEYTASKAECETLLELTAPELPLIVARPSVVVGHTRLGCAPSASIFWYYRALSLLRRFPVPPDVRKDIVPVDYVAQALVRLLLKPSLRYGRYHVSAGEGRNVSWQEIAAAFEKCRGNRTGEPWRVVDFETLVRERGRLRGALSPGDDERVLAAMRFYFPFSTSGVEAFDNARLLGEGVPPPPRFTDYLPVCETRPANRSVYAQMAEDLEPPVAGPRLQSGPPRGDRRADGARGVAPHWACGEPLAAEQYAGVMRRAIFECCKWHLQTDDRPVVCPFPLILEEQTWTHLAGLAAALARELEAAEKELLQRPDLHVRLGLPRALLRPLRTARAYGATPGGARVVRFDFHWTRDGWRISEANADVAGGFVEASGVTRLLAQHYPDCRPAGDPAGTLADAVLGAAGPGAKVGFLHLTAYSEDRQVMLYLAQCFEERGLSPCLFSPEQMRWNGGHAGAECRWHAGRFDFLVRFFPAEWLPRLPARTRWARLIAGGKTPVCNPAYAVLTQSKRFPLIWDELSTPLPTFRSLLPESRSPREIGAAAEEDWVLKPALGHEGYDVAIHGVTDSDEWARLRRVARRDPESRVAQRRFEAMSLQTPDGPQFPCVGVYVIDGHVAGAYGRVDWRPLIDDRSREVAILVRNSAALEKPRTEGPTVASPSDL